MSKKRVGQIGLRIGRRADAPPKLFARFGCLLITLLVVGTFVLELLVLSWPVRLVRDYSGADLSGNYETSSARVNSCHRTIGSLGLMYACELRKPIWVPVASSSTDNMRSRTDLTGRTVSVRVYVGDPPKGRSSFRPRTLTVVPDDYPHAPSEVRRFFSLMYWVLLAAAVYLPYRAVIAFGKRGQ